MLGRFSDADIDTDHDADPRQRLVAAMLAVMALMDIYELAGLVDGAREAMGLPGLGMLGEDSFSAGGWN